MVLMIFDFFKDVMKKIDKEKITQSSAVNVEGYVLDAREKNPSISGTMANQISKLNTNLSSIVIVKSVKIYAATTIGAGEGAEIYFSVPSIKNYKCVLGIGGTSSNNYVIQVRASDVPKSDGTLRLHYKNISSGATTVNDLYCNMIFVRY